MCFHPLVSPPSSLQAAKQVAVAYAGLYKMLQFMAWSRFQERGRRQRYCNHLLRQGVHKLAWIEGFVLGLQDIFH